jgi:prepilin peptidase CpaA
MEAEFLWPAGLTILLAIGALSDIKDRRLPNWLSLLLLIFGLGHAFALGGLADLGWLQAMGWHLLHAVIALAVGAALFAGGIFGGGDAKFYAGLAAYFTIGEGLDLLLWVSILGFFTIIGWMIGRRLFRGDKPKKDSLKAKFPYGVAIAAGGASLAWLAPLAS